MTNMKEKILSKMKVNQATGCWEWTAGKSAGYGVVYVPEKKRNVNAHRVSYEIFKGPIENGLHIDHLCRNTECINPAHLEAVTCKENVLRGVGVGAINIKKTQCSRGHLLDYIAPSGQRDCRKCRYMRKNSHRARNRDSDRAYQRLCYRRKVAAEVRH